MERKHQEAEEQQNKHYRQLEQQKEQERKKQQSGTFNPVVATRNLAFQYMFYPISHVFFIVRDNKKTRRQNESRKHHNLKNTSQPRKFDNRTLK